MPLYKLYPLRNFNGPLHRENPGFFTGTDTLYNVYILVTLMSDVCQYV